MLALDVFARDVPMDITNLMQMITDLQRIMLCPRLSSPGRSTSITTQVDKGNELGKENGAVLFNGEGITHLQSLSLGAPGEDSSVEVECSFVEKAPPMQGSSVQNLQQVCLPVGHSGNALVASEHEAVSSLETLSLTETHTAATISPCVERNETPSVSPSAKAHGI